jgi:spore germination protein GerM
MRLLRAIVFVAILAAAAYAGYRFFSPHPPAVSGATATVYYTKLDGDTLAKWVVSVNPNATDTTSVAFYATAQAVAGPPADTAAVRFPAGTVVRSVHVEGSTANVDLGGAITTTQGGSFAEGGEFKALVWTLTSLPGVTAVQVKIDGARVPTLPGGHLELDEPLTRQSW